MSLAEAPVLNTAEAQQKFLDRIHAMAEKWANKPGEMSTAERCHGVAHSVLSIIDGSTRGLPHFELTPTASDEPVGSRESDKPWPSEPLNAVTLLAGRYATTYDKFRQGLMLAAVDLFD